MAGRYIWISNMSAIMWSFVLISVHWIMVWSDRNISWLWQILIYFFKILGVHDIVGGDGDILLFVFEIVTHHDASI
jgi:hypothetical protein